MRAWGFRAVDSRLAEATAASDRQAAALLDVAVSAQSGVLPEGFALPALPYLVLLLVGLATVVAVLWVLSPPITNYTVVALAPWMVLGGVLHALDQIRDLPDAVEPLFGTPAVYATTAIVAGSVWILAIFYGDMIGRSADRPLGVIGTGVVVTFLALATYGAIQDGTVDLLPASVVLVVTGVVGALVWTLLGLRFTDAAAEAGASGVVVVAAHVMDGVSTAVGYDMLGAGERSPVSELILEAGAALPTEEFLGAGWLFVLVKVLVAAAVVVLFRAWLEEDPEEARIVLAGVAAVGLGPAANNLVLFTLAPT